MIPAMSQEEKKVVALLSLGLAQGYIKATSIVEVHQLNIWVIVKHPQRSEHKSGIFCLFKSVLLLPKNLTPECVNIGK